MQKMFNHNQHSGRDHFSGTCLTLINFCWSRRRAIVNYLKQSWTEQFWQGGRSLYQPTVQWITNVHIISNWRKSRSYHKTDLFLLFSPFGDFSAKKYNFKGHNFSLSLFGLNSSFTGPTWFPKSSPKTSKTFCLQEQAQSAYIHVQVLEFMNCTGAVYKILFCMVQIFLSCPVQLRGNKIS